MPGLFPCVADVPIPYKTIVASRAGVYALLQNACWGPDPKTRKEPPATALFTALTGRLRILRTLSNMRDTPFSQAVRFNVFQRPQGRVAAPQAERLARQRKRPLSGDWGASSTKRFYRFSRRRKSGKSFRVYHETLLATIENNYSVVRLLPLRRSSTFRSYYRFQASCLPSRQHKSCGCRKDR